MVVSQPEAARLLGVSIATLRRMVTTGSLPVVYLHPGAHPRFRRSDLERLVGQPMELERAP